MSCRAWLLIAAIGLAFQAQAFAQGLPEQPLGQQTEGERQQQQGGTASWGFPVRIIEEPEQSESATRQEREAVQREIEALEAQRLAAKFAYKGYWVSVIQAVLSFGGAVLIFFTLLLNGFATMAAVEGAKVASDTLAAQFRPRIRVGIITMGPESGPPFAEGMPLSAEVNIVNIGNFEASLGESYCQIYIGEHLPMVRPYQNRKPADDRAFGDIFERQSLKPGVSVNSKENWKPGVSVNSNKNIEERRSLTAGEISRINDGSLKLFVMGYVQYAVPNGKEISEKTAKANEIRRRTMFCRVYCPCDGRLKPTNDSDYEVEN